MRQLLGCAPEPTTAPVPFYENCDEVRAAGDAPLYRGDPGYAGLDGAVRGGWAQTLSQPAPVP
ncbi:excalibur calcium-binding domain-containing protein [Streptomyces sp. NPDC086033]|uniref:excalibur calcium-binding domain-containing protein n=1 Tax=Streptomyces sp. NPDC086033 TaxID=3365747 RepID=UPI0037D31750